MDIFLATDATGLKLATRANFWKDPQTMTVDPKVIWKFLRAHGWSEKEIKAAGTQRRHQTPEQKAANAEYERKRSSDPARRERHKAYDAKYAAKTEVKASRNANKRERRKIDPTLKIKGVIRENFARIRNGIRLNNLPIDPNAIKREMKKTGDYDVASYEAVLKRTLPEGVTMEDWAAGRTNLEIDHIFPLATAVAYDDAFPGLLDYAHSPENFMFLDASTNYSKRDKIILELLPSNVPGYPFEGLSGVYNTLEEARLPREQFAQILE